MRKGSISWGVRVGVGLGLAVFAAWCGAAPQEPLVTPAMRERALISRGDPARLEAVLAKARRGEPICVVAIGGSITAGGTHTKDPGRRYIQQLARWFEVTFPGLKVRFVNAGIGSTNSGYGALRIQRDVLAQHPDLVVVEFAVNDSSHTGKMDDSYEGVLRQLLSSSPNLAVIELFFMHKDGTSAQPEQVRLGHHYGLPMISFRDAFFPEYKAGRMKWEDYYDDMVHPDNEGHDIASELLRGFLSESLAKLPAAGRPLPAVKPVPAPLITDTYERCTLFRGADLNPTHVEGWTCVRSNSWECRGPEGRLDYQTSGTTILLGRDMPVAASNAVTLVVDGGKPVPVRRDGHNRAVVTDLPQGPHQVSIRVHGLPACGTNETGKVKISWGGSAGLAPAPKL